MYLRSVLQLYSNLQSFLQWVASLACSITKDPGQIDRRFTVLGQRTASTLKGIALLNMSHPVPRSEKAVCSFLIIHSVPRGGEGGGERGGEVRGDFAEIYCLIFSRHPAEFEG